MAGTIKDIHEPFGKTLTLKVGPNKIVGKCLKQDSDGMYVILDLDNITYHLVLPRAEVLLIHTP